MNTGLSAVIWKEWRESLRFYRDRLTICTLLFILVAFVVGGVIETGRWKGSAEVIANFSVLSMLLVALGITDSIAGEKERKTLESLLSTPVKLWEVAGGKILAASLIACGVTTMVHLVLLVIVLARSGAGLPLLVPLGDIGAAILLGFLSALFIANWGSVLSIRAATVRQAQFYLGGSLMVVLAFLMYGHYFLPRDAFAQAAAWLDRLAGIQLFLAAASLLAVLNLSTFLWALHQYRRLDLYR